MGRLHQGGQAMVQLDQGLHVDGQAGLAVPGLGVHYQPGQRVVPLQHVPGHTVSLQSQLYRRKP